MTLFWEDATPQCFVPNISCNNLWSSLMDLSVERVSLTRGIHQDWSMYSVLQWKQFKIRSNLDFLVVIIQCNQRQRSAVFPFVPYVLIRLCSWFVQQLLMLEATLLFEGMGLHDHHRELRLDVDNMSYEVWHHAETNGNPAFILGSCVLSVVFRGHGTDLCFIILVDFTSSWNPVIRCTRAEICASVAVLEYSGVAGFGRQNWQCEYRIDCRGSSW